MTNQDTKCPDCGGPIEVGKPCPNCLLKMVSQSTDQMDADLDDLSIPGETTDGQPKPAVPDIEAVRKAFPQLEIIEMIGRGGMGTVFKARQPKLDRYVALKILAADLAAKPAFADRFAREGKLLARLSHPNIVSVYDYGQAEGLYYLILEYVDGVNLRQAMREKKFSPEQALSIVPKICDALQYAHDEGVLHRDIKPENILLDTRGRIKITDFGIGKLTEQSDSFRARSVSECPPETANLTNTGQILGTPNYMAPEQLDAPNTVDHRADIYSLGVVFYELLTGELPKGRFPLPSEKTPVGVNVDEIVLKALQRERDQRYQTAGEMKTSVETASQQFTVSQALPPETAWDAFRKVPLWMFLFAFFALMFVLPSLVNLAAIIMDFFSGDFNKKWADVYFAPIPLLIFITIVWIMRHWQIRPVASPKKLRETGTEHPSSLKTAPLQNRSIFPIIAIVVLGYAIPIISQLIGAPIFRFKPWFIGLDLPAIFFWGLLNMIAVGTAIILFRASRTWWEPLRYFSVIGGYGVLAYYYSWFDIASDAQAGIGLIFIPIFAIPGFIVGFFTGCFLNYLITRSRRRQEPQESSPVMKTQEGDRKAMPLWKILLLLLFGSVLSCVASLYTICNFAFEPGNTRHCTRRALGGGNCTGAWAVIEPSSQNIVFASPKKSPSNETGVCDIYTMSIDGTGRKQLTFGTDYDGQPAVSPDGKTVAFISERDGPSKVYMVNTDGTGLRRLTQGHFNDSIPVFSRDGSEVFFARRLSDDPDAMFRDEVFSIGIDGLNEQRLTDNMLPDAPVAGSGKTGIYYLSKVDTPTGENRMNLFKLDVTKKTNREVLPLGIRGNTGCDISPDEQWITYVNDAEKPFEYEVYVCRIDGSDIRKLTNFHGYIGAVRFASDGKHVIFVLEAKGAPGRGKGDIYVASIDGKMLRKIGSNHITDDKAAALHLPDQ